MLRPSRSIRTGETRVLQGAVRHATSLHLLWKVRHACCSFGRSTPDIVCSAFVLGKKLVVRFFLWFLVEGINLP